MEERANLDVAFLKLLIQMSEAYVWKEMDLDQNLDRQPRSCMVATCTNY